jgi:glycine cleavage system H lipoate-binding protein
MQAGVVTKKPCEIDYECSACHFDRVMHQVAEENRRLKEEGQTLRGKRGKILSWREKLKAQPPSRRPCVHHMKGRIEFRICTHEYQCSNCDFDQFFDEQYSVHAVVNPVDFLEIKGFKLPQGYYFHPGHTWAKLEKDETVRVGLDEFALRVLGPFDRIEGPLMGKLVRQGESAIMATRGELDAKILSPVSGVVTAINPKLREEGRAAGRDPYSGGWVMSVHVEDLRRDLRNLMIKEESGAFMGEEVNRLYHVVEEVAGPLAADGGQLGNDIYGNMPELGWDRLTKLFLRT